MSDTVSAPPVSRRFGQRMKTRTRMMVVAILPLVLFIGFGVFAEIKLAGVQERANWVTHTQKVLIETNHIITHSLDMEIGLWGFLLAGQDAFLNPYETGSAAVFDRIARLQQTVSDNPPQVARLGEAADILRTWQQDVAQKKIDMRRSVGAENGTTMEDVGNLVAQGRGKQYFDSFRDIMADFAAVEERLMVQREAENDFAFDQMRMMIPTLIAVSVILGAVVALIMGNQFAGAMRKLIASTEALQAGELDTDITESHRGDEIGELSRALETFRTALSRMNELETTQQQRALEQAEVIKTLSHHLSRFSDGDLTADIHSAFPEDFDALRRDFNATVARMRMTIDELMTTTRSINQGAQALDRSATELSGRTENQAATLEQTAAALEQLTNTVDATAGSAREAASEAGRAKLEAEDGNQVVTETIGAMSRIEESARQISKIVTMIDDIAFQTNLLALNAGVEAARAGSQGKGFAVVASEVQQLAHRSAEAATEIKTLIASSSEQVETGSGLVRRTGDSLGRIAEMVAVMTNKISGIAEAAAEQSAALNEVNSGISNLDEVTQKNAGMVVDASEATSRLASEAVRLNQLTSAFQTQESLAGGPASPDLTPNERQAA